MLTDISAFGGNILGKFTLFPNKALKSVSRKGNSIRFFALEEKKKKELVLADYSKMKESSCLPRLPEPGGLKPP